MRELKFKIWTGSNMIRPQTIKYFHESILSGITVGQLDSWIYLQFTGKSDKDGKEIYKGDIISIDRYGEKLIGEVKQLDGGQYYIDHNKVSLKYQHQIHCEVCDTESPIFFLQYFDAYELEVIGNIYQNPELLNTPTP